MTSTAILMDTPIVWTEIRVGNLESATAFYGAVLQNGMAITTEMGPQPMAVFAGPKGAMAGHLVQGKPASDGSGPLIHFNVHDSLDAARARVKSAGGSAEDFNIDIPDGAFFYATDPDGNAFGLFKGNS